ncbi:hypothetical protein [Streptomyces sp. NPDC051546]|uniref:hypothetical protein n=1 Tax=Streptomyces sp. NPDC051546 TaxID=3365655 RepID=UPI0037937F8E
MSDERTSDEDLAQVHAAPGRMVYTAATVEMTVEITGALLAVDAAEAAKLKGETVGGLSKLTLKYAKVAGYLSPSMRTALEAIVLDVKAGMDHRNAYVHGPWGELDGVLSAMNSKPFSVEPSGFRTKAVSVEHLDRLTGELEDLRERVMVWFNRAWSLKHPDVQVEGLLPDTAPPYPA